MRVDGIGQNIPQVQEDGGKAGGGRRNYKIITDILCKLCMP
jgi:hypothetical protein